MNQEKSKQSQSLELLEAEIEQVSGGKATGEIQRQYAMVKGDDTKSGSGHVAL